MPWPSNQHDEMSDDQKCAATSVPDQPMQRREGLSVAALTTTQMSSLPPDNPAVEGDPAKFAGAFLSTW